MWGTMVTPVAADTTSGSTQRLEKEMRMGFHQAEKLADAAAAP
jgi:hypothetical protein